MDGISKSSLHQAEVGIESVALQVLVVGVPADVDVRVVGHVKDCLHHRQLTGAGAMDFDADLLPKLLTIPADFLERLADLLDGFLARYAVVEPILLHLHSRDAA
ncbi:MAG: hypothetical protein ACK559_22785, partial [bacterium]